ncbi:hypothetical protein [Streptomyces sp. NPDC007172]|uniref:hypothetical protein n=1 Tax=Streptomyces sp. NPDC007172 TaxID=3364776 RepID=UPI0036A6C87E
MRCPVCSSPRYPCRGALTPGSVPAPRCPLDQGDRALRIERRERLLAFESGPEWNQGRRRGPGSRLGPLAWAVLALVLLVLFLL